MALASGSVEGGAGWVRQGGAERGCCLGERAMWSAHGQSAVLSSHGLGCSVKQAEVQRLGAVWGQPGARIPHEGGLGKEAAEAGGLRRAKSEPLPAGSSFSRVDNWAGAQRGDGRAVGSWKDPAWALPSADRYFPEIPGKAQKHPPSLRLARP